MTKVDEEHKISRGICNNLSNVQGEGILEQMHLDQDTPPLIPKQMKGGSECNQDFLCKDTFIGRQQGVSNSIAGIKLLMRYIAILALGLLKRIFIVNQQDTLRTSTFFRWDCGTKGRSKQKCSQPSYLNERSKNMRYSCSRLFEEQFFIFFRAPLPRAHGRLAISPHRVD